MTANESTCQATPPPNALTSTPPIAPALTKMKPNWGVRSSIKAAAIARIAQASVGVSMFMLWRDYMRTKSGRIAGHEGVEAVRVGHVCAAGGGAVVRSGQRSGDCLRLRPGFLQAACRDELRRGARRGREFQRPHLRVHTVEQ